MLAAGIVAVAAVARKWFTPGAVYMPEGVGTSTAGLGDSNP
jgi:hypothetical protein